MTEREDAFKISIDPAASANERLRAAIRACHTLEELAEVVNAEITRLAALKAEKERMAEAARLERLRGLLGRDPRSVVPVRSAKWIGKGELLQRIADREATLQALRHERAAQAMHNEILLQKTCQCPACRAGRATPTYAAWFRKQSPETQTAALGKAAVRWQPASELPAPTPKPAAKPTGAPTTYLFGDAVGSRSRLDPPAAAKSQEGSTLAGFLDSLFTGGTIVRWRPPSELPPRGASVLAVVSHQTVGPPYRCIVHAWYARANECPLPDDLEEFEGCTEGPDGEIYLPEGWVETSDEGETDWSITGTVTHWAPMPKLPPAATPSPAST